MTYNSPLTTNKVQTMTTRLNLYLPKEVTEALKQLAEKNYRTVTAEALIALTKHLKAESEKGKADGQ